MRILLKKYWRNWNEALTTPIRILGIDPGSRTTGFGVIDSDGSQHLYVTSGCIRVKGDSLADKLKMINQGISEIIRQHQPAEMAIEQVFMHRNAGSALKLGQARGAAILTGAQLDLPVDEYTPSQVKQAITGRGNADKDQINHMVRILLNLSGAPQEDAADALAIALCHSHRRATLARIPGARSSRGGRLR